MTKNPFLNACAAIAYISVVASFLFYGSRFVGPSEDTVLAPITMLSLFVFSAAVMAYIFFYQPVQMYFDGEKKQALSLFLKTLLSFGVVTIVLLVSLLFLPNPASPKNVRAYVEANIAELSPQEAVLGGTFYITEFKAEEGKGVVSYEDGHVAYTADFEYEAEDGELLITSFSVRDN
jgi:hypothetical protein